MIFDPLLYWLININFSEVALRFLLHAKQQYSTNASLLDNDSNQVVGYIIQKRNDFFLAVYLLRSSVTVETLSLISPSSSAAIILFEFPAKAKSSILVLLEWLHSS